MTVTDCWWQAGEFTTHSLTYFSVQIVHAYSYEHFTFMCNGTISFLSALLQPSHRANRKLRNDKWHPDVILWLLLGLMKGKKSHRHASPVFPAIKSCHEGPHLTLVRIEPGYTSLQFYHFIYCDWTRYHIHSKMWDPSVFFLSVLIWLKWQ